MPMKNKNVIRKKLVNGEFTTIHNSILFDTRLTPNAFRLMTAILSDSDTHFNLSQTLYCKRLKIAKKTFFNAVAKLEECGYLKKTPTGVNNTFNYTLSEYGNLNNIDKKPEIINDGEPTENNSVSKAEIELMHDENSIKALAFNKKYNHLMCDDFYFNVFEVDFYKRVDYDIIIEKFEKYLYKTTIASITDSHINPKSFEEFKAKVKNLIFNHKKYDADFMNSWTILKLTKNRKQAPRDHETEMGDYYENPID
jgi:DNA-binding MarR family transcriptional regulator